MTEITNEICEPNYQEIIKNKFNLKDFQVENTLKLIDEDATVPFIARYRKETTGNLDEDQIRNIIELRKKEQNLFSAKKTAINGIFEQDKLTIELKNQILNAKTISEVEDIYTPYKRKKKTKSDIAKEKGFEIISNQILNDEKIKIPEKLLENYSKDEIISGAQDIITQEIVDDSLNKKGLRNYYLNYGEIESTFEKSEKIKTLTEKTQHQKHKFEIYNNFTHDVKHLKSYQTLAINRGENLGILKVKLNEDEITLENLQEKYKKNNNQEIIIKSVKDAHKKIFKSIETEIRNHLTEKSEITAIESFKKNLEALLMTKPKYGTKLLAIDPGFRTGCKLCVIDEDLKPIHFDKIFLEKSDLAISKISEIIKKYNLKIIALGNGTGSNELYDLITKKTKEIKVILVNEDGASVYSASEVAKEEFPNLDLTDRGTISIGRRFIDPLAELVKIPVANIGVGMYQHDMNQKLLEEKLTDSVIDVVNKVGINVNTASYHLLKFISGLTLKTAKKIYENRPYKSRQDLKKILSKKAFEQSVGFLRVPESKEELDNTNIHPESYETMKIIIKNNITETNFRNFTNILKINLSELVDLIKLYNEKEDPRKNSGNLEIEETKTIEELKIGDIVSGIVRNVMQFGCFVDIGIKQNGLVHISELADKFIKDPNEIVSVGQVIKAKIIGIDIEKNKLQLSMKQLE